MGGMYKIVDAWRKIAGEYGVTFHFGEEVNKIDVHQGRVVSLNTSEDCYSTDGLIAAGDYHYIEQNLLSPNWRMYDEAYWDKRVLAPSSLLYFIGVKGDISGLTHHNLFFDEDLDQHADMIYKQPDWPDKPLFYVCCPSKTDPTVAPSGHENLFILIPVAPGLEDFQEIHDRYFQIVMDRLEKHLGQTIRDRIVYHRSFGISDFQREYHAFKGNAYGLANTLHQTAFMKPSMRHKKIHNLFFAGQLTMPGPGLPPSMISGNMAAHTLTKILAS